MSLLKIGNLDVNVQRSDIDGFVSAAGSKIVDVFPLEKCILEFIDAETARRAFANCGKREINGCKVKAEQIIPEWSDLTNKEMSNFVLLEVWTLLTCNLRKCTLC